MVNRATVAAVMLLAPVAATAQPVAWNRSVEAIAALPVPVAGAAGDSFFDVFVEVRLEASDITEETDLSVIAQFSINGVTAGAVPLSRIANPPQAANCSGLPCNGQPCYCTPPPPPFVCECGPVIVQGSITTGLSPGDEITVILFPAPGAVPEIDTSDDSLSQVLVGPALYWSRRVSSLEVVPVAAAAPDSFFDIIVDLCEYARYSGALDLSSALQLQVNGTPVASQPVNLAGTVWDQCNAVCTGACVSLDGLAAGACAQGLPYGCACAMNPITHVFPAIPLDPGDEITVILRPAPGGLPELPGLEGDDQQGETVCPWDCSGDGNFIVDTVDFLALLAGWGPNAGSPCDFNDDGLVDTLDFLELLAHWGPCFPV